MIKAVLWDFGGVLTTSPFEAFNRFERENGLPRHFIRSVNATNPDTNAWARFERSEITFREFDLAFERETGALGHPIRGTTVLELLFGDLRPEMVEALRRCRGRYLTACLTNNMNTGSEPDAERFRMLMEVMAMFDVVVESSKIGVRKPDPEFYRIACDILNIRPSEAVFLDDLGVNLKPARAMGMSTIRVSEPGQALRELEALLGMPLGEVCSALEGGTK